MDKLELYYILNSVGVERIAKLMPLLKARTLEELANMACIYLDRVHISAVDNEIKKV